ARGPSLLVPPEGHGDAAPGRAHALWARRRADRGGAEAARAGRRAPRPGRLRGPLRRILKLLLRDDGYRPEGVLHVVAQAVVFRALEGAAVVVEPGEGAADDGVAAGPRADRRPERHDAVD